MSVCVLCFLDPPHHIAGSGCTHGHSRVLACLGSGYSRQKSTGLQLYPIRSCRIFFFHISISVKVHGEPVSVFHHPTTPCGLLTWFTVLYDLVKIQGCIKRHNQISCSENSRQMLNYCRDFLVNTSNYYIFKWASLAHVYQVAVI